MASLFTIPKTFRPRRVILSNDMNTLTTALKAVFDILGDAPVSDGRKGVSTPFAVGTPTQSYHAVDKATLDASPASATSAAASAAAAATSETNAAASEAAAAASVVFTLARSYVDDADTALSAVAGSQEVYMSLVSTARTVTLPSSPVAGMYVSIIDVNWLAGQYNITVARNGQNIQGVAEDLVIDVDGAIVHLVYLDSEWKVVGAEP